MSESLTAPPIRTLRVPPPYRTGFPGPPAGREIYAKTYLGTAGRGTLRVPWAAGEPMELLVGAVHCSHGASGRIDPAGTTGREHMGAAQRIWPCSPDRVHGPGASPRELHDLGAATLAQ